MANAKFWAWLVAAAWLLSSPGVRAAQDFIPKPFAFKNIEDICDKASPTTYRFSWTTAIFTQLYENLPRKVMAQQNGPKLVDAVKAAVGISKEQSTDVDANTQICNSDDTACTMGLSKVIKTVRELNRKLEKAKGKPVEIAPYAVIIYDGASGSCYKPGTSENTAEQAANRAANKVVSWITGTKSDDDKEVEAHKAGSAPPPAPNPAATAAPAKQETTVSTQLRIANSPSQFLVPIPGETEGDLLSALNDVYRTDSGAKLSFGETSGSNQVSNQVVGAAGFQVMIQSPKPATEFVITPYVYIDREEKLTNVHGQPTNQQFSQNLWGGGINLSAVSNLDLPALKASVLGVRPDYLIDYCNGSRLASLNLTEEPIGGDGFLLPVNRLTDLFPESAAWKFAVLANLQARFGWYQHRAPNLPVLPINALCTSKNGTGSLTFPSDPRVTRDFARLGGQVGLALELRCLFPPIPWLPAGSSQGALCFNDYPVDISATYTDFYPVTGFNKSLGYFQALGKLNLAKGLSITAQYSNGRRPDNAVRYEAWTLGFGVGF